MPSTATYRVSNREEDKIRGRDQSFRNCIVTMFIFIMLCVIIILVSIPWRNANARNNYEHRELDNSHTEPQLNGNKTEREKISGTLQYPKTSSTKSQDTTTIASITIQKNTEPSPTIIVRHIESLQTTTGAGIDTLPTTIQNNIGTSGNIRNNVEVASTTIPQNIEPLSTTIQDNVGISSNIFVAGSQSTGSDSSIISPKIESSTESIFQSSTGHYTTLPSESFGTSIDSSVEIETSPFSSSSTSESSVTEMDGFFYTEATEGSTVEFSTESTIDFSSTTEQLLTTTEVLATHSERVIDASEQQTTVTSGIGDDFTSLKKLIVAKYFGNESSTSITSIDMDWLVNESITTVNYEKNYTDRGENKLSEATAVPWENHSDYITADIYLSSKAQVVTMRNISTDETSIETSTPISDDKNENGVTTNIYTDLNQKQFTTTNVNYVDDDLLEKNESLSDQVCVSGSCKQFSSRILSYMNHSADPCEDFYEYACGGMEADPQINSKDLSDHAFDRIKNQLKKSKIRREYPAFMNYYNSCIEYYQETTQDKKILKAKEMLAKIGQFYTPTDWFNNSVSSYPGITKLIANMILHNSPLLFDITLDVNEMDSQKFILRLMPFMENQNSLYNLETNNCNTENDESSSDEIDMKQLYRQYADCKNNERQSQESIVKALEIFGIFDHINYTFNKSAYIEKIVTDIDHRIIKAFTNYPCASEIHAEYKSKNYSIMTLGALQVQSKFINWTELIYTLTGKHLTSDTELQIYIKDQLIHYLQSLERFGELFELNNALLGLYARNLYEQFVKPQIIENSEKQCLHIAMNNLPSDAAHLYLSSFTKKEMDLMNFTIHKVFMNLKETLKLTFERAEWTTGAGRNELLKKIEKLQISIPNNFNLKNISNINMAYDFFDSTVILMKKLRADIYRILNRTPSDPEQLWTYFAKPFQSHGVAIYSLNLILIPFGAVDMSNMLHNNNNFDYLTLATIGNFIAREIAHHFDTNGIFYWNGTRHSVFPHFNDQFTKAIYDDYINCHSHLLFQEPLNIILPASNKHIRIVIPETTLNDRLCDVMGVRLAHDTLARMESTSSKLLPWLDLDIDKLFYLAYAQTYCTKTPLTASYISLYERSIVPGRLRIFAAATNNKMLGELWKCREGSPILSNFACDIFPYFEYHNAPVAVM